MSDMLEGIEGTGLGERGASIVLRQSVPNLVEYWRS